MARLRSCRLAVLCLPAAFVLGDGAMAQGTAPNPSATGRPAAAAVPPAPSPAVSFVAPTAPTAPPPTDTDGDRADAIARDMLLHPPQRLGSQQDAARLHAVSLKLSGLLDRSVHGSENSEVGRVIDVLVGEDGRPAALELDVGGFMGVGNRKIAVAWALFDVAKPASEPLRVALTEGQVKSAPAAEDAGGVAVVTGDGAVTPSANHPRADSGAAPHPAEPAAIPAASVQSALPPAIPALGLTPPPSIPMPPVPVPVPVPSAGAPAGTADPSGVPIQMPVGRHQAAPADAAARPSRSSAPPSGRR